MKFEKQSFLKGNLWIGILLYSLPLCLTNILQVLFNISDVAIVGKFAGAEALGAVGSCTTLVTLFTTFMIGVSNGMCIYIARYRGENNAEKVRKAVFSSFVLAIIVVLILFGIGVGLTENLLRLIKTKEDLFSGAVIYLRIYFLGIPGVMLYNFGSAVLQAVGETKKPLYILTFAGIMNVLMNLVFVISFNMATAGVALASMLSQYISATIVLILIVKEKADYGLRIKKELYDHEIFSLIARLSLISGLQNAIFAIANLFIQSAVNTFDTITVEGNSAAMNADSLVYDVMAAFYSGCASFVSQNYGAKNKKRILKSYLVSLTYSFLIGLAMGVSLFLLGEKFLSLFTDEQAVVIKGMERLQVMSISYAFSAFMDCTIASSRGLGKSLIPTIIVIIGSCLFRIVWIYTIVRMYHTIKSIYLVYICSWAVTSILEIAYFIPLYKRKMQEIKV